MKRFQVLVLVGLLTTITSCAKWLDKDDDNQNPYRGIPVEKLYADAQQSLHKKQYDTAAKKFEALETMYPFSSYAEKAQMSLIYTYYKNEDYPSTAATAERYIHLFPRAKNVDYAYYMKALANFQQNRGAFTKWFATDESQRDPGTQSLAYSDFATLIQQFPKSKYKADALQRMIYLRNMFAQRELNAARYYFDRKMYVAAAERASFLVKNYPQAPSAEPALLLMRDANLALGLPEAADEAMAVYQATYHKTPPRVSA